jgi:hypothetical protein
MDDGKVFELAFLDQKVEIMRHWPFEDNQSCKMEKDEKFPGLAGFFRMVYT